MRGVREFLSSRVVCLPTTGGTVDYLAERCFENLAGHNARPRM